MEYSAHPSPQPAQPRSWCARGMREHTSFQWRGAVILQAAPAAPQQQLQGQDLQHLRRWVGGQDPVRQRGPSRARTSPGAADSSRHLAAPAAVTTRRHNLPPQPEPPQHQRRYPQLQQVDMAVGNSRSIGAWELSDESSPTT